MSHGQELEETARILLAQHWGDPAAAARCQVLQNLSPGLSGAVILRLGLGRGSPWGERVIVKIVSDGHTDGGFRQGGTEAWREVAVYRDGLIAGLTGAVVTPRVHGVDQVPGGAWIWLEDAAAFLNREWDPVGAARAVESIAALHLAGLAPLPWGEGWDLTEYDSFSHHLDQARASLHAQLDPGGQEPRLLPPGLARTGLRLLDLTGPHSAELAKAPRCFQHGDFHIDNLGWSPDGRLLALDWAQAGLGPIGGDVAVFLSNFTARGGEPGSLTRPQFDELMVERYCAALASLGADRDLRSAARRGVDLWSVTWAVQVRVGPGLSYARRADLDPALRERIAQDIREGLERAAEASRRLGSFGPALGG
jgi:hypothetical protein